MNCVWITVDSFRQDHVHCYRPEGTTDPTGSSITVHTPNIDKLAAEGVMCTRLRSEALPTVPCRRGIFTGRRVFPWPDEPPRKGMYLTFPGWRPLPDEDITVSEYLSENGYVCAMVTDVYHLMKPAQNFHRFFHSYEWIRGQEYDMWRSQPLPEGYIDEYLKPGTRLDPRRLRVLTQYLRNQMYRQGDDDFQAARVFRAAIEWLERNYRHERFFLYIDSFDPHEPFEAPQRFIDMYDPDWSGPKLIYANIYRRQELTDAEHHHIRARYAAECTMVDYWIGQLLHTLSRLGLSDNTLVVLVSDHGKILGEWNHYGMPPADTGLELNAVPCIIRHPAGQNAGARYTGWVYNTDVTATMLALLGADDKPQMDGVNFWPAVSSGEPVRDCAVVGHAHMVSCWCGDWLYLVDTERNCAALYNLADDPFRQYDVADRYPTERKRMESFIDEVTEGG